MKYPAHAPSHHQKVACDVASVLSLGAAICADGVGTAGGQGPGICFLTQFPILFSCTEL